MYILYIYVASESVNTKAYQLREMWYYRCRGFVVKEVIGL